MTRTLTVGLLLVLAGLLVPAVPAMGGGGGGCHTFTERATAEIELMDNCFNAAIAHVQPGQTVTWTNRDQWQHNLVANNFEGTSNVAPTHRWTFTTPGIYPYACTIHHGMVGAIVVGEPAVPAAGIVAAPTPTETASATGQVLVALGVGLVAGVGIGAVRRRLQGASG